MSYISPPKGEAEDHFRQMLRRHPVGSRIPPPDATELSWLLERHPEVTGKIGVGVDYFSVRNAVYGTKCFEVVRTDSVATDFSFGSCVSGRAPLPLAEAISSRPSLGMARESSLSVLLLPEDIRRLMSGDNDVAQAA